MRKRLISTLIASLFAAIAVAVPATAAHANYWDESAPAQANVNDSPITAAADYTLKTTDGKGGYLHFTRHGDEVKVCDEEPDGYSAVGYVWDTVTEKRIYGYHVSGHDNCETRDYRDYNMVEGRLYAFRICIDHNDLSRDDDRFCRAAYYKA